MDETTALVSQSNHAERLITGDHKAALTHTRTGTQRAGVTINI